MMRGSSVLTSSSSLCPSFSLSLSQRSAVPCRRTRISPLGVSTRLPPAFQNCSHIRRPRALSSLQSTATQEVTETSPIELEFVEVGYISSVHGIQGEVRVKPRTDFPELRFSKPGKRWLRQQVSGREKIQEVELVGGRGHPGQKSWIVRFKDIDTVDLALQLVGSTILVTERDRPELEECEFYTHDLVGMKVVLKETGEFVGTVVNVFNSGASDLLHVMLNSVTQGPDTTGKSESQKGLSGPLVWVPFVEAIVPNVDMNKREMLITPPRGLLELNIRTDERSKKERRQLEWKERKKFQKHLIAAKKKLCEIEQHHVFHGFRYGEKDQRSLLADQIVGVNSKLLQQALQNIKSSSNRLNFQDFLGANLNNTMRSTMKMSDGCVTTASGDTLNANSKLQKKGSLLTSGGKLAVVLVVDDNKTVRNGSDLDLVDTNEIEASSSSLLKALCLDDESYLKTEDRLLVPLILIGPIPAISYLQKSFWNHDYYGFDSEKVWFMEEEKLPVISYSLEELKKHKILMKSPWEILQKPIGSGGVISLLSSNNILENLNGMGVEYVEIRSFSQGHACGHTLLGLVHSLKATVGIQLSKEMNNNKENFDTIFSMKFLNQLTKQINNLHFDAVLKPNPHVEKVEKEWVDVIPSSPNSYEFYSSIYSCLTTCPPGKICIMEVEQ